MMLVCFKRGTGNAVYRKKLSRKLIQQLQKRGIKFEQGLTQSEIKKIESEYSLKLPQDFIDFYTHVVLIGDLFYNWRDFSKENISKNKEKMTKYIEQGITFDIENNNFWYKKWGRKPLDKHQQLAVFFKEFAHIPKLIPIYGHRFMPTTIANNAELPIISVSQTDVIYYGHNILDFLERQFLEKDPMNVEQAYETIPFWTDLINGKNK